MSGSYGQYGQRPAPFSLRLDAEERRKLERLAGNMPISSYIKSVLFPEDAAKHQRRRKPADADAKLLAEVLACLGASRISNNLNQLAKAANSGTLYFDYDTKQDIKRACDDVHVMRMLLMQALGLKIDDKRRPSESTSQSFARASAPEWDAS